MINGDTPAISHALGFRGHSARFACRFCKIDGLGIKSMAIIEEPKVGERRKKPKVTYYPILKTPPDTPARFRQRVFDHRLGVDHVIRTPQDLDSYENAIRTMNKDDLEEYSQNCGVSRSTCLWKLQTIRQSFPFCAPEESMHTIFLNLIPQLVDLTCGLYFDNVRIFPISVYNKMGKALVANQKYFPVEFGERIPNIVDERRQFQASTWNAYALMIMPISFLHNLPVTHQAPWSRFFWTIQTIHAHIVEREHIELIDLYMIDFVHYLEG
ncbi:MAG: hypothetical protein ACRYGK_17255 [Janthinobacterium lividum]